MSLVTLKNINHQDEETTILHNESWSIEKGQHWVVMGPNGSGKTTLLRILTGYLTPTAGEIETLGGTQEAELGWFDIRKHIGWVSQALAHRIEEDEFAGDVVLTGKEGMIGFWGEADKKDVARNIEILKETNTWHLRDRTWAQLSQGERQRILIGRALMNEAKILVLDEPCAGLDPVAREHFLEFLQTFMTQPNAPTVILVTHHVEEILKPFTHALLLKEGKITHTGPLTEIITAKNLSQTLGAKVTLTTTNNNRLQLNIDPTNKNKVF